MNSKYNIIYADPPWRYRNKSWQGSAEKHYKTLSVDDLCSLPVSQIAAKDCVLFLWATYPTIIDAFKVIQAWGFSYKTLGFQWIKTNTIADSPFFGIGTWTRSNTEPCLLATRGKPVRKANNISQLIFAPKLKHSQKPEMVRSFIVDLVGDLPRIELFASQPVPGWDAWGSLIDGCDIREKFKAYTENDR